MDDYISYCKKGARENLKGNWGVAILALLIQGALLSISTVAGGVGELIVTGPLSVGVAIVFLTMMRGGEGKLESIFDGFKNCFMNSLVAGLLTTIFVFLWSLLFVIPGIVKAFGWSMTPYILADNPEMDGREAMRVSQNLMKGYKGKLFLLNLSFIGWILLTALTFGILTLYVGPWMEGAKARFYDWVKTQNPQPELVPTVIV